MQIKLRYATAIFNLFPFATAIAFWYVLLFAVSYPEINPPSGFIWFLTQSDEMTIFFWLALILPTLSLLIAIVYTLPLAEKPKNAFILLITSAILALIALLGVQRLGLGFLVPLFPAFAHYKETKKRPS